MCRVQAKIIGLCVIGIMLLEGCSSSRYLDEGQYILKNVKIVSDNPAATRSLALDEYIKQRPTPRWSRMVGQKPTIYSGTKAEATMSDITQVLRNEGYAHSVITEDTIVKGQNIYVTYHVSPGVQYHIASIERNIADSLLAPRITGEDTLQSLLHAGMPLNLNTLNEERGRIASMLQEEGYYKFNKEHITFDADTLEGSKDVDLRMNMALYQEDRNTQPTVHGQYRIGSVTFNQDVPTLRQSMLESNTLFKEGDLYSAIAEKATYNYLNRLSAVSYSNIKLTERPDSMLLDATINIIHAKEKSISFDIEGTNSDGDLGAAASTSFQHQNLFRGSEQFMLKLRGAYESISGLDGYEGKNFLELTGETSIAFPGFLLPYVSKQFGAMHGATSEINLQYTFQNRPEFNRRVLSAAWRYKWHSTDKKAQHKFDLLEVNFIRMPWISSTFRHQYLDSLGRSNAILKYNYEDQLITKIGYTYTYNSLGTAATTTYGKNAFTYKLNIETSGNVLSLIAPALGAEKNSLGQEEFLGIAYAQYVKGDAEFTKSIMLDKNYSIALHAGFGIAYPYGNSTILPFEKRYFAGGANSLRGWSVRSLGPGNYNGEDHDINFINQSGDMKLDLSAEFRAYLFWKLNGAVFIDAGNIWTIKDYEDQPGGQFRLNKVLDQIAVSYGLGLRFNFDFFVLRFDAGMKAINPAYTGRKHFPIICHDLSRDFAFHFAVGLPF